MFSLLLFMCIGVLHVLADKKCYDVDGYAWVYESGSYRPASGMRVDLVELDDNNWVNQNDHVAGVDINNDGYFQFTQGCGEDGLGNHPEVALFFCKKPEKCTQNSNIGRCDLPQTPYVQHLGNITVDHKGCAKIMTDSVTKPRELGL